MSLCAPCGLQLTGDAVLCQVCQRHHVSDDWSVSNRIMCDFVHRKKVLSHLTQTERDDEFWTPIADVA